MTKTKNQVIAATAFDWKEEDEKRKWIIKMKKKKGVKIYELQDAEDAEDSTAFIAIRGNLSQVLKENDIYGFDEAKASDFKRVA